jgi:flagellar motor protein MotB
MTYQEMYRLIADNHSEHWGGTFADMVASDKALAVAKSNYPEIYAQAQADFNEYLSKI